MKDQILELSDGRRLGYAEYGDPEGLPMFFFHGFPGSRLDWLLVDPDDTAAGMNIRVIAPDRPGYGLSDFKQKRKLTDWPGDVEELANALSIDDFSVFGLSGGGPYAAACGYKFPQRIFNSAMVCSMGPPDAPDVRSGVSWTFPAMPALLRRLILRLTSLGIKKDPDRFVERSLAVMAADDARLLGTPKFAVAFTSSLAESFRQGIRAADQEASLYRRPWGFDLHDITLPVSIWHGESDLNVPVTVPMYMAKQIPDVSTTFSPKHGHLTLPRDYLPEILAAICKKKSGET